MMDKAKWQAFWKILKGRLIFAAFLLGACFVFTQWIVPVMQKPSAVLNLTDAGDRQLLRLRKNFDEGRVYELQIRIRGKLNGTAKIRMFDAEDAEKVIQEKIIGSGEVDTRMGGDWYSNDCRMEYEPLSATDGQLKLEYRFLTSEKKSI